MIIRARYNTALAREGIGVLQQLQILLNDERSTVTLADALSYIGADEMPLVSSFQEQYGATATLEEIIQMLVAHDLQSQLWTRRLAKMERRELVS